MADRRRGGRDLIPRDEGNTFRPCAVCGSPIPEDGWGMVADHVPGRGLIHHTCRQQPPPRGVLISVPAAPAHPAGDLARDAATASADPPAVLTVADAAALLAVSKSTIRAYIRAGQLRAFRLPNSPMIRLHRADVLALLTPFSSSSSAHPDSP